MAKKSAILNIVNYKNSAETQALLDQLRGVKGIEKVEILVVDNTDGHLPLFEFDIEGFPTSIQVLRTGKNLGYMGAGRYGYENLKNPDFDWFILANSDLEIAENFFVQLFQKDPYAYGLVGPAIISSLSRNDTNPYMITRPSAKKMHQIARIFSNTWLCRIYQYLGLIKKLMKRNRTRSRHLTEQTVYAVHGAMLIFSQRYFANGGTLNLPCFLFNEEIFAAETCRKFGLRVLYAPDLEVIHREHGSMGWNFSRQILGYKKEAARAIYEQYFKEV